MVSACLMGRACRYDGAAKGSSAVQAELSRREGLGQRIVPVCPEELGGLGTPRPAAHLVGGDGLGALEGTAAVQVVANGADVTAAFTSGARAAQALAPKATEALLKSRSPSCGCGVTRVEGELVDGDGVFAALLRRQGLRLFTEEDLS